MFQRKFNGAISINKIPAKDNYPPFWMILLPEITACSPIFFTKKKRNGH